MNRKESHNDVEKKMTCKTLPNLFFNDVESTFNEHFVNQWLSDKLLQLTLAAVPSVSKAIARWLLNMPVEDSCAKSDSRNENTRLPSLASFIKKKDSLGNVKKQHFFAACRPAIVKIACGDSLLQSDDSDASILQKHVNENWIPLPSAT